MHQIQKILLKRLLLQNKQKYSTLTKGYDYEDNIVFHLKQLKKSGMINKADNHYQITSEGIKIITNYDLPAIEDRGFKTFFIGFLCSFDDSFLIKEHPTENNNFYNLPSGKPRFGEQINQALIRTFAANTGIKLEADKFKFLTLHLKTIETSKGEGLFDDAFAIYNVNINKSEKENMKPPQQISLKSIEEIKKLSNRWPEIDILILKKDFSPYLAYEFISDYILLE